MGDGDTLGIVLEMATNSRTSSNETNDERSFPAWFLYALLIFLAGATYWPVIHCGFINFDDPLYVTENPVVQRGLTGQSVQWAFSSSVSSNWHPLTMLSHMLDCQLFGLKPWGHHLVNVILHSFNAALVFAFFRKLSGWTWRSFFIAALFAVHPLHVESVAWISERKDVLSAFFGLWALVFYVRYANRRSAMASRESREDRGALLWSQSGILDYAVAFLFLALGLLSKPMLVTWPFVMLLLDYWPLRRFSLQSTWRLIREKIPFLLLILVSCAVTFIVQKRGGSMLTGLHISMGARVANALVSYSRYLLKIFWPTDLAIFYPLPSRWPITTVLLVSFVMVAISAIFWTRRFRWPFLLVGWLWFLGTLVPVIGLVQAGEQAMADRYTYLPSLGVFVIAVWGAAEFTRLLRHRMIVLSLLGSISILVLAIATRQQLAYWRNSEVLFRRALAVTPDNPVARDNLGNALLEQNQVDEAMNQYLQAISLDPAFPEPHYNLALALVNKGQTDDAIAQFREVIRLKPDSPQAFFNLGVALKAKGQFDDATAAYREAVRLAPDNADARYSFGTLLGMKGQLADAALQFRAAIRLKPDFAEAHDNLGNAFLYQNQVDAALTEFREAIRLNSQSVTAHNNLAMALEQKGLTNEAITELQYAVHLAPNYFVAHSNLADALYQQGRLDEAIIEYQELVRLRPDDTLAQRRLAYLLAKRSQPPAH